MGSSTIKLPPIACWSVPDDGKPSPVTLASYAFVTVNRNDSSRRKRPVGIELLKQGTTASTRITTRSDLPISYRIGKTTVYSSVCSNSAPGYGGETLPSQDALVLNKLRSKARNMSVNLANALGEYKQTASMFYDGCKIFAGLIGALHSRNPRVIKRYLFSGSTKGFGKSVSKNVLMFQYGVKPLISDIEDSVAALKKRASIKPIYQMVRATTTDSLRKDYDYYDSTYSPTRKVSGGIRTELTVTTKAWALIEHKRDILNRTLGQFGFTNPLAVAYELTPFSFVLDWWFNVGEFLQSLDNSLYFDAAYAQTSRREVYKRFCTVHGVTAVYTQTTIARSGVGGLGTVAQLRFKPNVSSTHIANGLALITQALSKLK